MLSAYRVPFFFFGKMDGQKMTRNKADTTQANGEPSNNFLQGNAKHVL